MNAFETRSVDADDDVARANRGRTRRRFDFRRSVGRDRVERADEVNVVGRSGVERFGGGESRRVEGRPSAGFRPIEVSVRRAVESNATFRAVDVLQREEREGAGGVERRFRATDDSERVTAFERSAEKEGKGSGVEEELGRFDGDVLFVEERDFVDRERRRRFEVEPKKLGRRVERRDEARFDLRRAENERRRFGRERTNGF